VLGAPDVQPIAEEPGLTLRDGLLGVGVLDLAAVLADRGLVDAPA